MELTYPTQEKETAFRKFSSEEVAELLKYARRQFRKMEQYRFEGHTFNGRKGPEYWEQEIAILEQLLREEATNFEMLGNMRVIRRN